MTFDCENTQLDDDTFFLFVLWHFRLKEVIRVMSSKKKKERKKKKEKVCEPCGSDGSKLIYSRYVWRERRVWCGVTARHSKRKDWETLEQKRTHEEDTGTGKAGRLLCGADTFGRDPNLSEDGRAS